MISPCCPDLRHGIDPKYFVFVGEDKDDRVYSKALREIVRTRSVFQRSIKAVRDEPKQTTIHCFKPGISTNLTLTEEVVFSIIGVCGVVPMSCCGNCGNYTSIGDRYCSQCGSLIPLDSSDVPFWKNDIYLNNDSQIQDDENCPRCGGSGTCTEWDNLMPGTKAVAYWFTFGLARLTTQGEEECERCGGTGWV